MSDIKKGQEPAFPCKTDASGRAYAFDIKDGANGMLFRVVQNPGMSTRLYIAAIVAGGDRLPISKDEAANRARKALWLADALLEKEAK